jgi:HEPN domain-containing protein
MDRREIREVSGYTFTNQQSRAESWYDSAISFREGANVFGLHKDSIPGGTRVFLANVALSIELLLKAIIVAKNGIAPRTHRLPRLVHDAGVPFSTNQEATLELLGELLIWSGRYPVPNKAEDWDHYYDVVFERHVIRVREGSAAMVLANRRHFRRLGIVRSFGTLRVGNGTRFSLTSSRLKSEQPQILRRAQNDDLFLMARKKRRAPRSEKRAALLRY